MKLEILVPRYNESEEVLKALLDSILIQQHVDFSDISVMICDDGSKTKLSDEFLSFYRKAFSIGYYQEPHRGISATRNSLLDRASADYVMFCDADDMFYTVTALWLILSGMKNQFDVMICDFMEEGFDPSDGQFTYLTQKLQLMYIHGKVYRRQYLLDENIRFPEEVLYHEEHYFNSLCYTFSENIRHCEVPVYLWRWRNGSITTANKFNQTSYPELIHCKCLLIDELIRRGADTHAAACVGSLVYDVFYTVNSEEWCLPENDIYRKETERRFFEVFQEYKGLWDALGDEQKLVIAIEVQKHTIGSHDGDVDAWLNSKWKYYGGCGI